MWCGRGMCGSCRGCLRRGPSRRRTGSARASRRRTTAVRRALLPALCSPLPLPLSLSLALALSLSPPRARACSLSFALSLSADRHRKGARRRGAQRAGGPQVRERVMHQFLLLLEVWRRPAHHTKLVARPAHHTKLTAWPARGPSLPGRGAAPGSLSWNARGLAQVDDQGRRRRQQQQQQQQQPQQPQEEERAARRRRSARRTCWRGCSTTSTPRTHASATRSGAPAPPLPPVLTGHASSPLPY